MIDIPTCEPFPVETLLADGWLYRDTPPMLAVFWDQLLDIIGEGNYRFLTTTERTYKGDDRLFTRGQMFISPDGIERMKAHVAKAKGTTDLNIRD